MKYTALLFCLLCTDLFAKTQTSLDKHLQPTVFAVTMVMIHDVVNPPAASRFYTYCLLGAHEIIAKKNKEIVAPGAFIRSFPKLNADWSTEADYQVAALYSILETGKTILPSGYMLEEDQKKLVAALLKDGYSRSVIDASIQVATEVSREIAAYASTDNYLKLSTQRRYRPKKGDAYWYPTPPGYIEGIEPHWRIIRPMVIDSNAQFAPPPPVPYSADTASAFYKLTYEVYKEGKELNAEKRLIASFWDCNPFAINTSGHMSIGFKKMSPGGHWMGIAGIAADKAGLDMDKAILVHSLLAVTLMDGFISCWDEKYRSDRVRPETVIGRLIDARWQPLLQTPPFPEYTSGHSVISSAAAEMLTFLLGDHFAFTDDTEILFDLPRRDFTSFYQAANEAAISRLYGGIHYRDAIEEGQKQGSALARFMILRMKEAGVGALK